MTVHSTAASSFALAVFALSFGPTSALAITCDPGDSTARVAHLRDSCGSYAPCQDTLDEMSEWIDDCNQPSASKPLLVHVGPGTFEGQFTCIQNQSFFFPNTNYAGHVTFRGSGRETTTLQRTTLGGTQAPVVVENCENIGFENIRLFGGSYAVAWIDGGSSSWTNVDLEAGPAVNAVAWIELPNPSVWCDSEVRGQHYFHGSTVTAHFTAGNRAIAYVANCGETWFYGGEVTLRGSGGTGNTKAAAINVGGRGMFQGFGTLVRALSDDATGATFNPSVSGAGLVGALVGIDTSGIVNDGGGTFHLHGGNLVANSGTTSAQDATSLYVGTSDAFAHTPGSSFVAQSGTTGTATRLTNLGTAFSPFLWQASDDPPTSRQPNGGTLTQSTDGHDLFVETDCDVDGDCEDSGTETHLMVYNETKCGATDPWFNVVTGRCRNDTGP